MTIAWKHYFEEYGYGLIAGLIIPEGFGVPAPGQTALIASAILASRNEMSLPYILLVAFFAAVLGNSVGYALGYYGGRPLVVRYGRYIFITEERLRRTEVFFEKHGGAIVLLGRFFDVVRQLNGIVAGIVRMPYLKFQVCNVLGAAIWVLFWGLLAFDLGHDLKEMRDSFVKAQYGIFVLALMATLFFTFRFLRSRKD
ncbi:MAG: DedA family protein [Chitinivibrionia bacterium]|nr:DedA family protein [Chitinivibrionia bacterium]